MPGPKKRQTVPWPPLVNARGPWGYTNVPNDSRSLTNPPDAMISNGFLEKGSDGEVRVWKRLGFTWASLANYTPPVHGVFRASWGSLIVLANGRCYLNAVDVGAVAADQFYWFAETQGAPSYVYFSSGAFGVGYTISSTGVFLAIIDATYTGVIGITVPGAAYLDGTTYVMNQLGLIYGSLTLNNPKTWSALNQIAQSQPDTGVGLSVQNVYIVAFKQRSIEFFYDAGVPIGSPLLPVQNAKIDIGCADGQSIVSAEGEIFFVGKSQASGILVGKLSGAKYQKISTPDIDRILAAFSVNGEAYAGICFRHTGHLFYVLQPYNSGSPPTIGITGLPWLVYDNTEGVWYIWLSPVLLAPYAGLAYQTDPSFINVITGESLTYGNYLANRYGDYISGVSTPVTLDIVTANFDGGERVRKVLSKLVLKSSQANTGPILVSWSDDDYQTWSPWISVNSAVPNPTLTNLGTFYRRAFRFRNNTATSFRMSGAEMDLLFGTA